MQYHRVPERICGTSILAPPPSLSSLPFFLRNARPEQARIWQEKREGRQGGGDTSVQHRIMLAPLCLLSFVFLVLPCFPCSCHGCMCVLVVALAESKFPAATVSSRNCCQFCSPGPHLGANQLQPKQPPRSPRQQPGPASASSTSTSSSSSSSRGIAL